MRWCCLGSSSDRGHCFRPPQKQLDKALKDLEAAEAEREGLKARNEQLESIFGRLQPVDSASATAAAAAAGPAPAAANGGGKAPAADPMAAFQAQAFAAMQGFPGMPGGAGFNWATAYQQQYAQQLAMRQAAMGGVDDDTGLADIPDMIPPPTQ